MEVKRGSCPNETRLEQAADRELDNCARDSGDQPTILHFFMNKMDDKNLFFRGPFLTSLIGANASVGEIHQPMIVKPCVRTLGAHTIHLITYQLLIKGA